MSRMFVRKQVNLHGFTVYHLVNLIASDDSQTQHRRVRGSKMRELAMTTPKATSGILRYGKVGYNPNNLVS